MDVKRPNGLTHNPNRGIDEMSDHRRHGHGEIVVGFGLCIFQLFLLSTAC